jgi:hypothetical protein
MISFTISQQPLVLDFELRTLGICSSHLLAYPQSRRGCISTTVPQTNSGTFIQRLPRVFSNMVKAFLSFNAPQWRGIHARPILQPHHRGCRIGHRRYLGNTPHVNRGTSAATSPPRHGGLNLSAGISWSAEFFEFMGPASSRLSRTSSGVTSNRGMNCGPFMGQRVFLLSRRKMKANTPWSCAPT